MPSKTAERERKERLLADNLAGRTVPPPEEPQMYVERTLEAWSRGGPIDRDSLAFNIAARIASDIRRHREYPKDWDAVAIRVFRGRLTEYVGDVLKAAASRELWARSEAGTMRLEDYEQAMDQVKRATWEER